MLTQAITRVIACSFALAALGHAQGLDEKKNHGKHHRAWEWLQLLSSQDRAKFHAARKEAEKNPEVMAAKDRKDKADQEYRTLLHAEILRIDPSLKPLLEKITELEKREF